MTRGFWYRASLRDEPTADRKISIIREQFAVAVEAAGSPDGACLFLTGQHAGSGTAGESDTMEEADAIFFSPAAISIVPHLIAACSAVPSLPPDRACATLLVGKPTDWDLLPHPTH